MLFVPAHLSPRILHFIVVELGIVVIHFAFKDGALSTATIIIDTCNRFCADEVAVIIIFLIVNLLLRKRLYYADILYSLSSELLVYPVIN